MELPKDLEQAAELLQRACGIIARRLGSEDAPQTPTQYRMLASALASAQDARYNLGAVNAECVSLTPIDRHYAGMTGYGDDD